MKENDFSFLKLRDEIINKTGLAHSSQPKEFQKKLKFEPNLNVTRHTTVDNTENKPPQQKEAQQEQSTVVNLNEISSRFSNKDSLNLIKKPLVKKDKKTIVLSAESFLEPKKEEKKDKEATRGEDLLSTINNLKLKDPTAYLPTVLPFKSIEDESKTLDLNENDFYLFQFPRILPFNLEAQKKVKDEELDTEEPSYDASGFLIKNEFENAFKSLPKNSAVGKMKIYKSGKIKLQMGDTMFDVTAGINCKFAQELGIIFPKTQEAFLMGKVREKKLVVTPELHLD